MAYSLTQWVGVKYFQNKKVLLRERKRHTARRVASARYVGGGTPSQVQGGYLIPGREGGTLSQDGGLPHPRSGAVPHPRSGGGYPVPGQRGYPIPGWGWYPILGLGGYPIPGLGEYPVPGPEGYFIPGLGGTPSQVQVGTQFQVQGVPHPDLVLDGGTLGTPHPDLGWGTPLTRPGMGLPPNQTWDGVPPRPEMGYPPHKCGQTHRLVSKHYRLSYYVRGR